jgi:hypothetical protein
MTMTELVRCPKDALDKAAVRAIRVMDRAGKADTCSKVNAQVASLLASIDQRRDQALRFRAADTSAAHSSRRFHGRIGQHEW